MFEKDSIISIDTSCDNTCLSIMTDQKQVLFTVNIPFFELLNLYGGFMPDLCTNHHIDNILNLKINNVLLNRVKCVAVTSRPGIKICLTVGVSFGVSLAYILNVPIFYLDHIISHALSVKITNDLSYPYYCFVFSGGHCFLLHLLSPVPKDIQCIAYGVDDAPGEVIDKIIFLLGFKQPFYFTLNEILLKLSISPKRLKEIGLCPSISFYNNKSPKISFSGIKSFFVRCIKKKIYHPNDILCGLLLSIFDVIKNLILNFILYQTKECAVVVFSGGIFNNVFLCNELILFFSKHSDKINCFFVNSAYASDNAEMVGWHCHEIFNLSLKGAVNINQYLNYDIVTTSVVDNLF